MVFTYTGIHPIATKFVDEPFFNTPFNIRKLLRELKESENFRLKSLVMRAYGMPRRDSDKTDVGECLFFQGGDYSLVFLCKAPRGISTPNLIMQIARGNVLSHQGRVVEQDHKNLVYLDTEAGEYFPMILGEKGRITVQGLTNVPVFFSEFLDGYHELNCDKTGVYTNRPDEERVVFGSEESTAIMREMVKIISYVFARTYDKETNRGSLIHGISLKAGDFVYRSFEDESQPLLKMITARIVDQATPRQFLFYLRNPIEIELSTSGSMIYPLGFLLRGVENCGVTMLNGILDGLREVYGIDAERMLEGWMNEYRRLVRKDFEDIFHAHESGEINEFMDIPPGYRTCLKIYAYGPVYEDRYRRWEPARYPTDEDYALAMVGLQSIKGDMLDIVDSGIQFLDQARLHLLSGVY